MICAFSMHPAQEEGKQLIEFATLSERHDFGAKGNRATLSEVRKLQAC